jgi:hypothetical protein
MEKPPTLKDLQARWKKVLIATQRAVAAHPAIYRQLRAQAAEIVENPIDINDYFPVVEKLVDRLTVLDPGGSGSIFEIFSDRISPSTIWQIKMLRMECRDLLAHLDDFDEWRRGNIHLRMVKGSKDARKSV